MPKVSLSQTAVSGGGRHSDGFPHAFAFHNPLSLNRQKARGFWRIEHARTHFDDRAAARRVAEPARAAIASQWQGKHAVFNDALHSASGKLDSAGIRTAADRAGVNWPRLQADLKTHKSEIDALLARTNRQATAIGLSGTPGLIIGNYLVPGALDLPAMRTAVAQARADARKAK